MYLGIDIGTSEIKTILVNEEGEIMASSSEALSISHPHEHWAEQNPNDWWLATQKTITELAREHKSLFKEIKGIGLAGQMHGAVLLDNNNEVLRPAILWNDTRSFKECESLTQKCLNLHAIAGNLAMPGFTAPKLMWVAKNEPEVFEKIATVLLPKDYIRFMLTGKKVADMSDAAGTLWLDIEKRDWSDVLLKATNMTRTQMPSLVEGNKNSAILLPEFSIKWGLGNNVIIAGGAGDNAASAVGVGAISSGDGFISLGTSGVIFVVNDKYLPNPKSAVHTFCHALPNRWHQMSVMLSAASCLRWYCNLIGVEEEKLLSDIQNLSAKELESAPVFLPYLSGERTPHNNPDAKGAFFGISNSSKKAIMGYSVIEGISFGMKDGLNALINAGATIKQLSLVGGGSRSEFWAQLLSSVLDVKIITHPSGQAYGALGAARLAAMACGEKEGDVCKSPSIDKEYLPNNSLKETLDKRYNKFKQLYTQLKPIF